MTSAYAHDPTLRSPVLGLGEFCVLCNHIGLSPPVPKPDVARAFKAVNAGAAADGREDALDYREFEECIFRLCRHPTLDSVTAGSSNEERLAMLLETMAGSAGEFQREIYQSPACITEEYPL